VLLPLRPPPCDDPEVAAMLAGLAAAADAPWCELDLTLDGATAVYRYTNGRREGEGVTLEIAFPGRFRAGLTLGTTSQPRPGLERLAGQLLDQLLLARRLQEQAAFLRSALDASDVAVLLFDRSGAIVYANPSADRLLSHQTEAGLTVSQCGGPPQPLFNLLCSVVETLVSGSQGTSGWDGSLALSDGTMLRCELVRVRPEGEAPTSHPAVLAHLHRASRLPELGVDAFAGSYGLSPREAEVLRLLVLGHAVNAIAERLGISPHTVRDHVKNLYRKTGSSSRNELLRRVAADTASAPLSR
jgi:DNA-binding CsgD family transcriptional regulator/PAS domain-containing protein